VLLDSNIIIYAAQPEHTWLRRFIAQEAPYVSAVSYVEVLGYHELDAEERDYLERFFAAASVLPIVSGVLDAAVRLRQQRRMSLGDSLVAGTALYNRLELVTRNVEDFGWIGGLAVINPFEGRREEG